MFALLESVHVIALSGPPVASDVARTRRSVSGVSVAENVASFPSPHVELVLTVTLWAVESSISYPGGAAVSWTEYVPNTRWSAHTVPSLPVVKGLPGIGLPFESSTENVAPGRNCVGLLIDVLVILIAPCWSVLMYVQSTTSSAFSVMVT